MKRYFTLLLIGFTFINCSNDDVENNTTDSGLIGTWNWIESSGGFDGRTETPESTGKNEILEISPTSIKKYSNGILDSDLKYSTKFGPSTIIEGDHKMIVYENDFKQSIILEENLLILVDECHDCFRRKFVRK